MHIVIHDEERQIRSANIGSDADAFMIGARAGCGVYLPDVRVADEHLRVHRDASGTWWIEICPIEPDTPPSFTRVFLNAQEVLEPVTIKHNDELLISRFRLQIFTDEQTANAPRAAIVEDASKIRAHPLPAGAIVRTDPDAGVVLPAGAIGWLTEFAAEIHECADLASLLDTITGLVLHRLRGHQVWLGVRRHTYGQFESVETRYAGGSTSGEPPQLDTFTYRCAERGQIICCPRSDDAAIESVMAVPCTGSHGPLGLLYVDNEANAPPFAEDDLELLVFVGRMVGQKLERVFAEQARLHAAVVAGELSFIRELQAKMDPTNTPQWDGLQMAVYCKPGLDSAGDLFDVMRLPNGLAAFLCGHVTGSPVHASLAMAEVRAAFRMASLHADPPHVIARATNWLLYHPQHPTTFTGIGIVMNPRTGAMQFTTAGTAGATLFDIRGEPRALFQPSHPPIGEQREFNYQATANRLDDGETLALYTPGCRTVTNAAGQPLGEQRFLEAVGDAVGQPASAALNDLLSDLKPFYRLGHQPDDITCMLFHRE